MRSDIIQDLTDAEATKRFEETVRRMANTPPPEPKPNKRSPPKVKTKKAPKASS